MHSACSSPGTDCMRLATMALKWARMSLRISMSLSLSASKRIRVRSTYSRKRAPRASVSRSRAPFVLRDTETGVMSCFSGCEFTMRCKEGQNLLKKIISFSPVTDDTSICQQLKDPEELESQKISPLSPFFILRDPLCKEMTVILGFLNISYKCACHRNRICKNPWKKLGLEY